MWGGPSQDGEERGQALRQCLPWNLQGCPRGSQNLPPNTPASLLTLGNCRFAAPVFVTSPWAGLLASTQSLHALGVQPPPQGPGLWPTLQGSIKPSSSGSSQHPITKESSGATWFYMYCVCVCASQPDGQALGPWLEGQEDTLLPTSYTFSLETQPQTWEGGQVINAQSPQQDGQSFSSISKGPFLGAASFSPRPHDPLSSVTGSRGGHLQLHS